MRVGPEQGADSGRHGMRKHYGPGTGMDTGGQGERKHCGRRTGHARMMAAAGISIAAAAHDKGSRKGALEVCRHEPGIASLHAKSM
jgi:hypothetical protein